MKRLPFIIIYLIAFSFTLNVVAQETEKFRDPSFPVEERVDDLLGRMTIDEKLKIIGGNLYFINGIERLGIPALQITDGPAGVTDGYATAFPAPIALAASWDTAMVRQVGVIIGEEVIAKGKNMIYAPNLNLFRNPLAGRNFESFGEDPYLASRMAVSFVKGIQSQDVIACARYFGVNTQEWGIGELDVQIDERTLREVYLAAFKAAVQEANLGSLRTGYNLINGIPVYVNNHLLKDILKEDWGFQGFVASKGLINTDDIPVSGADVILGGKFDAPAIKDSIESGSISLDQIDDKVKRILRIMISSGIIDQQTDPFLMENPNHSELALQAALEGIVLLKNHGGILPLDIDSINSVALIGPNLFYARTGGGGTSYVTPQYAVSPYEGIKNLLGDTIMIYVAQGIDMKDDVAPLDSSFVYIGGGVNGFSGKYYNNTNASGSPEKMQTDKQIDFNWWHGCPESLSREFSASWDAALIPPKGGAYKYKIVHNDGVRIYLDGKLILDKWEEGPVRVDSGWIFLDDGQTYNLQIDYFSKGGFNQVKFGFDYLQNLMIATAVEKALRADVAIVFAGLTDRFESMGFDRESWDIPKQSLLIREIYNANPNTIVVLQTGSPVDIEDWAFDIPAILQAWYPGQEGGTAIAQVLFGHYNPSGKLPFTWARKLEHYPAMKGYKSLSMRSWYKEGIHIGYRYMDKKDHEARFAFGHGMSYNTFGIGKLMMRRNRDGSGWIASVEIKNVGSRAGTETLQLYVGDPESIVEKAEKELKAFKQVTLPAGGRTTVSIPVPYSAFSYFDEATKSWTIDPGLYKIMVGTSAEAIKLTKTIELKEQHINQYLGHE